MTIFLITHNFYINTPTWNDLTFKNAFSAVFLKSSTLIHVTRYKHKYADWVAIKVNDSELKKLNNYLLKTFKTDEKGMKITILQQTIFINLKEVILLLKHVILG